MSSVPAATSAILTVSRATSYERRASIAIEADERQDDVVASVREHGFTLDWQRVERDAAGASEPLAAIEEAILAQLDSAEFRDTITALDMNGRLLAAYIQRQHEIASGLRLPPAIIFAEPDLFTPARAVAYWQKKLGLTDATANQLLTNLSRGNSAPFGMRQRIAKTLLERIAALLEEAIASGTPKDEFARQIRSIPAPAGWSGGIEDVTSAIIETEYRTHLTEAYSEAAHEIMIERAATFPFLQFMAIRDSRVTWWICGAMGVAGPGGKGYIVATDDPIVFKWRLPAHWRCRSSWSPISYLEAQRLGILARDGRTKIARIGSDPMRPFGDPPEFAEHPKTGELRRVEPQEGFGG